MAYNVSEMLSEIYTIAKFEFLKSLIHSQLIEFSVVNDDEDTVKLQEDIDSIWNWARSLGMGFKPVKCNIMQITRKQIKINAFYTVEGTTLDSIVTIKYLEMA